MNKVQQYSYVVQSRDDATGTMVLLYSAADVPDLAVSAFQPRADLGQTVADIARQYAPHAVWNMVGAQYEPPEIGASGVVDETPAPIEAPPVAPPTIELDGQEL